MLLPVTDAPALKGKRVLLRASLNAPVMDGKVVDAMRILQALPTITHLHERGAKTIIVSHQSGGADVSLMPVFSALSEHVKLSFVQDIFSDEGQAILDGLADGEAVLVENIRQYDGEEKCDEAFAKQLAATAEFFINDDFTVAHRTHASIVLVPKLIPSFMGLRFAEELKNLSAAFEPKRPAVLILGGAKPETKLPLAQKFLKKMDTVFIGGIGANVLFHAKQFETGTSIVHAVPEATVAELLAAENIKLPADVRVRAEDGTLHVKSPERIAATDMIVDAGPATVKLLRDLVANAKFILWNGPVGDYELGYTETTFAVAQMLTESDAYTVIGGGDTVASIASMGLNDKFTFVSTAGGAMIDFLANGTLPGIEALKS